MNIVDAFLKQYGAKASAAADREMARFGKISSKDKQSFLIVLAFLHEFPERLSLRGKKKPLPDDDFYFYLLAERFFSHRYKVEKPALPSTVPDPMVSVVMQNIGSYTVEDTERIKREHQLSMSAENFVGEMLERYVSDVLEPHGWAWCSGNFVRAVDLLKPRGDGGWIELQVKNRDNTENSSSSAIRKNTEIEKWFRTFAKTGLTNWAAFPDEELRGKLTEEGFKQFVIAQLSKQKQS